MDFGWGALISGIVDFAGKFLAMETVKLLRKHSDEYLILEKALHAEMLKSYDDMDDYHIADIRVQMRAVRDAFNRDMALAGGSKDVPVN